MMITDEYFKKMHAKLKNYTLVLIKPTSKIEESEADSIIWEHGRKNLALREEGVLSIVCPVFGNSELSGIYIFNVAAHEVQKIMDEDRVVTAGVFKYEIYPCQSFPGDSLA